MNSQADRGMHFSKEYNHVLIYVLGQTIEYVMTKCVHNIKCNSTKIVSGKTLLFHFYYWHLNNCQLT